MAGMLTYWCAVCGRERRTSALAPPARCPVCVLSDRHPRRPAVRRMPALVLAAVVVLCVMAACGTGSASVTPSTTPAPVPTTRTPHIHGYAPITRTIVVMPEDLDRCDGDPVRCCGMAVGGG